MSINEAMCIKMQDTWQHTAASEAPRLWWSFLFCLTRYSLNGACSDGPKYGMCLQKMSSYLHTDSNYHRLNVTQTQPLSGRCGLYFLMSNMNIFWCYEGRLTQTVSTLLLHTTVTSHKKSKHRWHKQHTQHETAQRRTLASIYTCFKIHITHTFSTAALFYII